MENFREISLMQFPFTAKIVRRILQLLLRILPITILGVYAAGCDLQRSKISATVVGSAVDACTTSDCETSFESYAGLSPTAVDANGVMQVSESQSTANAVVMPESSTLIIMGYAIVSSTATCLAQEPISNMAAPTINAVYAMGEGRWNICVAVLRDGKRLLLRSPEINVDTTSPTAGIFAASTGLSTTGFTLNWSAGTDNATAAASLKYFVCSGANTAAIDTPAECEAASQVMAYTANTTSMALSSLSPNTTYYYNAVVKDAAGNKSIYN